MAIALRGSAENSAIDGGDVAITAPAGVAQNDCYIVGYASTSTTNLDMQVSTAGYTELADLYANATVADPNLGVYRKIQGVTPDSTVTCVGSTVATDAAAGELQVFTGVDTTTPEDATTTTATTTGVNQPNSPTITTATANAWVLSIVCSTVSDTAVTAPTGYTNKVDINAVDSLSVTVGIASITVASPGAEDPPAWSGWATASGAGQAMASVALRPSAPADILFAQSVM